MSKVKWDLIEMIGDKVLIAPQDESSRTESGLYLPPGMKEKEQVLQGYVLKIGPGYMLPSLEPDEDWKPYEDRVEFLPLQVEEGDLAVFIKNASYELRLKSKKYYIVPQSAILMVFKDEFLDDIEQKLATD